MSFIIPVLSPPGASPWLWHCFLLWSLFVQWHCYDQN